MRRIQVFLALIALIITLLAGRAVTLQGFDSSANAVAAADRMTQKRTLQPTRGSLLDRNGEVLASTQPAVKVIADPASIATNGYNPASLNATQRARLADQTPRQIAEVLVNYLGGSTSDFLPGLRKTTQSDGTPNQYQVLAAKVPADTYQQMLTALSKVTDDLGDKGLYGITKEDDPVRVYPSGTLASNVVGFVNSEGAGAGGLEYYLNDKLSGSPGYEQFESSQYGRIPLGHSTLKSATNGTSYDLTIDAGLQYQAQQILSSQLTSAKAISGSTIVMNAKTGEVLAMATAPSFDSNNPGASTAASLGNRAVTDAYEPGSVEKVFTVAALMDAGLITPDTKIQVPGKLESGGGYINDASTHSGNLTVRGMMYYSSNIGAALVARQMDKARFRDYLASFGLGSVTGIQQPGESPGSLPSADMADYTLDQIAFGQGMSVTAIQMAASLAGVTNGGIYHQPTLLKSATDGQGHPVSLPAQTSRRVISEQASAQVRDTMEAVTAGGTGQSSRMITGYKMGAKSGTAQTINPATGRYDTDLYMSSYVTVAPLDDPQILVYTTVQVHGQYGATVAGPVCRSLMQIALPRYGVLPQADVPVDTEPLTYEP
ncbi:peptidoglycan D,D-transpeptidase FtsI family protein [Propionibacterium sp.]|uniref:peptidoglycan D,D-transpeptidase FtsI family protein n=1 Tax=Propionibacterium sp. TaxID=1977903 RepID=UPI0039ED34E5